MPDREKVVDGLERLRFFNQRAGRELWSTKPHDVQDIDISDADAVFADALELLKEQETKLICNLLGGQPYEVYCGECRMVLCVLGKGETMNDVKSIFSYCPHCGRSVKWDA